MSFYFTDRNLNDQPQFQSCVPKQNKEDNYVFLPFLSLCGQDFVVPISFMFSGGKVMFRFGCATAHFNRLPKLLSYKNQLCPRRVCL